MKGREQKRGISDEEAILGGGQTLLGKPILYPDLQIRAPVHYKMEKRGGEGNDDVYSSLLIINILFYLFFWLLCNRTDQCITSLGKNDYVSRSRKVSARKSEAERRSTMNISRTIIQLGEERVGRKKNKFRFLSLRSRTLQDLQTDLWELLSMSICVFTQSSKIDTQTPFQGGWQTVQFELWRCMSVADDVAG